MKFLLSVFGFNFLGNRTQFRKSFSIHICMVLFMFSVNSFSVSGFGLGALFFILQFLVHLYSSVQPEGLLPVFYSGVLCWLEILLAQLRVYKSFFFIYNKEFCSVQQSTLTIVVFQLWCILLPVLLPLKNFTERDNCSCSEDFPPIYGFCFFLFQLSILSFSSAIQYFNFFYGNIFSEIICLLVCVLRALP